MRPLDWAVLFAALVGIVAYGLWKGVSVALVAGQILSTLHSRREVLKGGGGEVKVSQGGILFADLFTLALLAPCLYMNVAFAYGPFS